jgi:hypothetical protein
VDRRDPGTVERPREIVAAELGQTLADPSAQLARGPLRVRDDEERVDVEAALADGLDEPLHEDGRLARPRPCGDEDDAGRVDRSGLLLAGRAQVGDAHLRTRHIG